MKFSRIVTAALPAILAAASAAFGANEYTGANNGDWFVDANWSLGRVPTAADDVEISSSSVNATGSIVAASITLSSATLRLGSETCSNVVASATISGDLTLEGASKLYIFAGELPASEWSVFANNATAIAALYAAANTVTVGGAFVVGDTSVVYPAAALLTGVPVFFRVGTFSLAEGASFDAKKRGWGWSADTWANAPANAKPRRQEGGAIQDNGWTFAIGSGLSYGVGGSYGGVGLGSPTTWQGRTYGTTYGSVYAPFLPGSPAGAYQMTTDSSQNKTLRARGPGSVVVIASGAATVDGTIDASGVPHASGYTYEFSGASGGGIWLAASSFSFGANASLLASGENSANLNAYAPGGGGRIAVVEGIDPADYSILLSGSLPDGVQTTSLDPATVAHTVAGGANLDGTKASPGTAAKVETMNAGAVNSINWTGATGTRDWFTRENWYPNLVPGPAHDVYCTNAAITVTNAITVRSLTIAGTSGFVFKALPAPGASDAASLYAAATTVVVSNRLEIGGRTTVTIKNDPVTGAAVKFACGDFLLGHDAAISANGGGWFWYASANDEYAVDTAGAYQTRALGRGNSYNQGAGHGGLGGNSAAPYGRTYGSAYAPFLPGSPNGIYNSAIGNSHPGGGTVWIVCSGTLELDGTITAIGERSTYGAPSGGGVWLAARGVTAGPDASVSAMGGTLTGDYGSRGGGGRVSLALGLTQAQLDALAAGETPEGLSYDNSIGLFAVDVRGGMKEAATPTYGSPGTVTTVRGALADTDILVRGAPVLATGVSPAYGYHGYATGTTATLTAPAYGYDPDDPDVRYPCVGYVVSNATTEVDSGAGTQVEFVVGSDALSVTWLWGTPQPRTVVRKPANGALRASGETLAGDAVFWSLGDLPAVSVVPDAGYAFVCWEGNVPFGQAFDNPLSLSVAAPVDIVPVLRPDEAAATRTWRGTGLWTDATKWSPAGNIPGPGDTVVVASGTCFVSNALAAAMLQVTGGTLSVGTAGGVNPFVSVSGDAALSGGTVNLGFRPRMTGHACLAVGGDLALSGAAKLNVYGGPVADAFTFATGSSFVEVGSALTLVGTSKLSLFSDYLTGGSVKVVADSVSVGASAAIEANEKGYMWLDINTPPDAPGLGFSYSAGASHGGAGGNQTASHTYGQRLAPVQPGSPGGCYNYIYSNINRGGGLVRIHAAGAIEVDGAITANANTSGGYGGGSGGGIWLTAHAFAFGANATLSARGGQSNYSYSNGGGGRIALGCQLTEEQIAELAATGSAAGVTEKRVLDEAGFRAAFGNDTMTVDVGSYTKNGAYADRPGTFVFINGKKYRTVIIVQ
jgi:hypothetical protein